MVPLAATVLAGSAFGFIFQVFLRQRDVLLTLAVLAVVAVVAAVPLAHRWGRPLPLVLLALWGLVVIPAFTLVPDLGYREYGRAVWMTSRISLELGGGWSSALGAWAHGTDGPLNVLLFVPAGMFLTLATRRPTRVVLAHWPACPWPSRSCRPGRAPGPAHPETSVPTCSAPVLDAVSVSWPSSASASSGDPGPGGEPFEGT